MTTPRWHESLTGWFVAIHVNKRHPIPEMTGFGSGLLAPNIAFLKPCDRSIRNPMHYNQASVFYDNDSGDAIYQDIYVHGSRVSSV